MNWFSLKKKYIHYSLIHVLFKSNAYIKNKKVKILHAEKLSCDLWCRYYMKLVLSNICTCINHFRLQKIRQIFFYMYIDRIKKTTTTKMQLKSVPRFFASLLVIHKYPYLCRILIHSTPGKLGNLRS